MTICIDPGHGMGNRTPGVYDSGAESSGFTEAAIVMDWANEIRRILKDAGHTVIRTRVDEKDPAPVKKRVGIATHYGCEVMLSFHCNAANGVAHGTETYYRSPANKLKAQRLNDTVVAMMSTTNRGAKMEADSQHGTLAIMAFPKCWLIELGFIDHKGDRDKMLNPDLRRKTCEALALVITQ